MSQDKPGDLPKDQANDSNESLKLRFQNWSKYPPKIKGWIVITYTIILLAMVVAAYFTPTLHLDKDLVLPFSSMMVEIFIILLATFAGGYFALATLVRRLEERKAKMELEFEGPVSLLQRMKTFRLPIVIPVLIVILMSIVLDFFYYPLSMNSSFITFFAFIILEISIVGGWFFVRFMLEVAVVFEEGIGGRS